MADLNVDDIANAAGTGAVDFPQGVTGLNQVSVKVDSTNRTSSTTDLLVSANIPAGTYRVTMGAGKFSVGSGGTDTARLDLFIDDSNAAWSDFEGGGSGEAVFAGVQNNDDIHYSATGILVMVSTWKANVDVSITGTSAVQDAYLVITRIDKSETLITTEWD